MPRCYAVADPVYQRAMRLITAITQTNPAQVTTSFANNYETGDIVRLNIPPADGMQQANGLTGTITVIDDTNFFIDIDATQFEPFAIPVSPNPHDDICAQVTPVGEANYKLTSATQNVL